VPAYVAFGVGGLGLIVGTVAGIVASNKESALDCPNLRCPVSEHDDLDSARSMALVSTVGFAVGAVGAGAGLVLLLTAGSSETPMQARLGPVTARPYLVSDAAGVTGTF
jgi:hypothetical protein